MKLWPMTQPRAELLLLSFLFAFILACGGTTRTTKKAPAFFDVHEAVHTALSAERDDASWFSEDFSLANFRKKRNEIRRQLGSFRNIRRTNSHHLIASFAEGEVSVAARLDKNNRIVSFSFGEIQTEQDRLTRATAELKSLGPKVGFLVVKNGKEVAAHNSQTPFAVASGFKLAVLRAAEVSIEAGQLSLTSILELENKHKSLPTGFLQEWPAGSKLTLQSALYLMISQSDNTATDLVIDAVGQAQVEKFYPGPKPMLRMRDFFVLLARQNEGLRTRYQAAGLKERRDIIEKEVRIRELPSFDDMKTARDSHEIEWKLSPRQSCELMKSVHGNAALAINGGLTITNGWKELSFKGGIDFGVGHFTHFLKNEKNDEFCVSVTWNETSGIDRVSFEKRYLALIASLHE